MQKSFYNFNFNLDRLTRPKAVYTYRGHPRHSSIGGIRIRITEAFTNPRDESFIIGGGGGKGEGSVVSQRHLRASSIEAAARKFRLIRLCQGERSKRVNEGSSLGCSGVQGCRLSGPICKSVPGCWILINVLVTRKRAGDAII